MKNSKTTKFLGKRLNSKQTVENIINVYLDADKAAGNWYNEANSFAAELANQFLHDDINGHRKACGIVAALSPLKQWSQNKVCAISFFETGDSKHTGVMCKKAKNILESDGSVEVIADILNGDKIKSFFLNIYYPESSQCTTIDRHALCIAVGKVLKDSEINISKKQYIFFDMCYRIAAEKIGTTPPKLQAITWVHWRKVKKSRK